MNGNNQEVKVPELHDLYVLTEEQRDRFLSIYQGVQNAMAEMTMILARMKSVKPANQGAAEANRKETAIRRPGHPALADGAMEPVREN